MQLNLLFKSVHWAQVEQMEYEPFTCSTLVCQVTQRLHSPSGLHGLKMNTSCSTQMSCSLLWNLKRTC